MQVASVCPQCGESYLVAPQQLGRTVRCQHCGRTFVLVPPQRPNPQQPGGQWQAPGGLAPRQASLSPGGPPQPPAARAEFDPYHQWLGIAPEEQPPHHYRLLGLKLFENSPAVIENAADRQMAHLRTFQSGKQAGLSQRLLNEVAAAKLCLLKAEKKAPYDEQLRRTLAPAGPPAPPLPPGLPQPPGLPPDPRALRQLGQYMARQQPADVAGVSGPFAAGADPEAVSDYGGQMPPDTLGSPDDGTQPGLESSATQDYGWMKEGPAQPAPKRRAARGKPRSKPQTAILLSIAGLAAALLAAAAALLWAPGSGDVAKRPSGSAAKTTELSSAESSRPGKGSDDANVPSRPPRPPADGQLLVTLPQDERQGARLEIDDEAHEIPPGGGPIKLSLHPGTHSLRIARPGYQAYVWSGEIEAGKKQTIVPTWEAIAAKPPITSVAQITAAYQQAVARLDAAEEKYTGALEPAEKLVAAWDFRGAAAALAKVQFEEADLSARLAARREEMKLLADLKARLIEKIKSADPPPKKAAIGLRGIGGQVTGADEQGISATLINEQEEKHAWAEYGDTITQKSTRKTRPLQELLRLAIDATKADDWLAAGLLALVCHEKAWAEQCFAEAQSLGAKTDPYLRPLAAAVFGQARKLLEDGKPGEVREALARFEQGYKHTAWFATYKDAVSATRELAARQVTEAAAKKVYAKAADSFNEEEWFDLKPLTEELKAKYAGTDWLTDAARKPSLADFEQALMGIGQLITVSQSGKADYQTIQAAIDAAPPRSRIEIRDAGPYNEPIVIPPEKETLTLRGGKGVYPVLTSVGRRTLPALLIVHAPACRLERLVLVHDQASGNCVASDASDVLHVHRCIVYARNTWGPANLVATQSVFLANTDLGDAPASLRDCVGIGKCTLNAGKKRARIENLLWPGEVKLGVGTTAVCCTLGTVNIEKGSDGITLKNSIVASIKAATRDNTIENCDVYDKEPYRDLAKPGKGCFSSDPQFDDEKNLDYRLNPKSPCRRLAAAGGNLGFTYTPEIIELLTLVAKLRDKGVIKL